MNIDCVYQYLHRTLPKGNVPTSDVQYIMHIGVIRPWDPLYSSDRGGGKCMRSTLGTDLEPAGYTLCNVLCNTQHIQHTTVYTVIAHSEHPTVGSI